MVPVMIWNRPRGEAFVLLKRRVRPFKADQSLQELPPEAVLCLLHEESEVMHVKRNHYSCLLHQAQQRMFAFNRQTSQVCLHC